MIQIFPLHQFWWIYAIFSVLIFSLTLLDLGILHRRAQVMSLTQATFWTLFWVSFGVLVGVGLYFLTLSYTDSKTAQKLTMEYAAGYVTEVSLSFDNLFVFILIFDYFRVPEQHKHRVLTLGILSAIFLRGVFLIFGTFMFQFSLVIILFGVVLMYSGLKLLVVDDAGYEPEKNPLLKFLRRRVRISPDYVGGKFLVRKNGLLYATPLLVALMILEFSDILFAFDSVPAVLALTKEFLIVFISNIMAILGLRSMFFLVAGFMKLFVFLKYGLGLILIFIGVKMTILSEVFGHELPIWWSLTFIVGVLTLSSILSLFAPKMKKARKL